MQFLKITGRILDAVYRGACWIAAACLIAMAGCVITSIISRLLDSYISGLTEIAGYLMAAGNCLALAHVFRSQGHIRISLMLDKLPQGSKAFMEWLTLLLTSVITVYVAWFMIRLCYFSWDFGEVSEGSDQMALWIPQLFTALGTVLLAMSVVHSWIEQCGRTFPALSPSRKLRPGYSTGE